MNKSTTVFAFMLGVSKVCTYEKAPTPNRNTVACAICIVGMKQLCELCNANQMNANA